MKSTMLTIDNVIELSRGCASLLDEKKAKYIRLLDLRDINSYLDFFIICTGNSLIHCKALAKEAQRYFKKAGLKEKNRPNMMSPWIALDYDEIVVHIFTEETRDYYQLEKLWADAKTLDF